MKLHQFIAAIFVASAGHLPADDFVLKAGDSVRIDIPPDASATERFAASEMSRYLKCMLNVQISNDATAAISIGTSRSGDAWWDLFEHGVTGPGADSFLISAEAGRLTLRGGGDRGTIYSVYDALESAGCRWFMPGSSGEVIPKITSLTLPAGQRIQQPAFYQREISSPGGPGITKAEVVDWEVKNRLNRDFNLRREPGWAERGGFIQWHWIAHNYEFILPPDENFKKHPEWFALYKNRRVKLGKDSANVCTTNPEVIDYFANFVIKWFADNPQGSVFPLSPPDGLIRWCECPECLKLGGRNFIGGPEGSMSRRQITFINAIAKKVAVKFPDRKILLLAYQNFVDPVEGMHMEPNVIVQPVNYGAFGKAMTDPANQRQRERFEGWSRISDPKSGTPGMWDYSLLQVDSLSGPRLTPLPLARVMAENIRFLRRLGGRYYFTQSGPISDVNPFVFYAAAKLLWNPETDLDGLLKDFCDKFYGPAGVAMFEYWNFLEDAVAKSDWNPATWPEITLPSSRVFTPDVLAKGFQILERAAQAARTPEQKAKIEIARASLESARQGVALARPWRLARGKESYVTNADAGDDVTAQVRGLAAERQNSGDPEGSLTRLINRLPKRERPLLTVNNGLAEVTVLPYLGGRILRLRSLPDGVNVFFEPKTDLVLDHVAQSYLDYGGYEEYLGSTFASPGWELPFELSRDGETIRLHAAQGSMIWSRSIALLSGRPGISLQTTVKNSGPESAKLILRGHPEMTLDAPIERLILVWRRADGKVTHAPLSGGLPEPVGGSWAIYDPVTNRGLIHRFDAALAQASLHLDFEKNTFNLETTTNATELAPEKSLQFSQEWEVFPAGTLEQLQSKL
ncbi:hypothetical protein BH09VER1_BH09VER1_55710 [soil metagenome]